MDPIRNNQYPVALPPSSATFCITFLSCPSYILVAFLYIDSSSEFFHSFHFNKFLLTTLWLDNTMNVLFKLRQRFSIAWIPIWGFRWSFH